MTYLSQLTLNPRDRDVRRDLADVHAMHRSVMRAFPPDGGAEARAEWQVLFRVDMRPDGTPVVIVQSAHEPDWSSHPRGYLCATPITKRIDDAYSGLQVGQTLRFRLRANPTRRLMLRDRPPEQKIDGKRVDIRGEDAQIAWIIRKGRSAGFDIVSVASQHDLPSVDARPGGSVTGKHPTKAGIEKLTLGSVLFEGVLRITDDTRFRAALEMGLGSGKAYGFGLLSLAPAHIPNRH